MYGIAQYVHLLLHPSAIEMSEYKKLKCKFLIVTGCLVQRYKEDLKKLLPEVDFILKLFFLNNPIIISVSTKFLLHPK